MNGSLESEFSHDLIEHLVYDSRRIQYGSTSLFFALIARHKDGHEFIGDAYKKGVRNFVISKRQGAIFEDANFIVVDDTLQALQDLAAYHRSRFSIPVIGITGSNGKTIVKEWLYQVLQDEFNIVRSPKSFNSQLGVALSVWQMREDHNLAIFEAGISQPGEMEKLERMIRPGIGVLTNIGAAHDDGFLKYEGLKLSEKLKLFRNAGYIIGREKESFGREKFLSWGEAPSNKFIIEHIERSSKRTAFSIRYRDQKAHLDIPFTDEASFENAVTVCSILFALGFDAAFIEHKMKSIHSIDMRLQLKHGINNCIVVNDSYSTDITSLKIALDFLKQQSAGLKPVVILSDFIETGRSRTELYEEIARLVESSGIEKLVAIGDTITQAFLSRERKFKLFPFTSTEDFLAHSKTSDFDHEIILVKGARKFGFERIAQWLERKLHQTVLEINLNALIHNLKEYQAFLNPDTRIMAMVKAFSYGSGGAEIASILQFHNIDYLGVAYADEGVELAKAGISLPVMVMNAEASSFQAIVDFDLQPVLYSFSLLSSFENYVKEQGLKAYPVHVEIETGMNRLGFSMDETKELARRLADSEYLQVISVFSHLAASEYPLQDNFTKEQYNRFNQATELLKQQLSYSFLRHISNSAAIVMHPELQGDLVRLGIGLYGVEVDPKKILDLQPVATLRSTIAQIRHIRPGDTVSYNRRGEVLRNSIIGTVRIGYADGYSRQFSNGKGRMLVKGQLVPVIGTVCMDMTMVDLTDCKGVKEGDEVLVFGAGLPVETIASWIETIPYEIMAGISQRVKRVYFHE